MVSFIDVVGLQSKRISTRMDKKFLDEFFTFKWSNSEDKILYLAEKLDERKEYFDPAIDWNNAKLFEGLVKLILT